MNNMLSLDKRLEIWESTLPNDKLVLIAHAIKKEAEEAVNAQNRLYNETVDTSYMSAFSDKYEDLSIEELREIIRRAYYYINDYQEYLNRNGEDYMKKIEKCEKELRAFLEKEIEAGTVKSEAILKAKKKFGIPAKDISNEWLLIKEEKYTGRKPSTKETNEKVGASVHKANEEKKKLKNKDENKDDTEEKSIDNVITPKTENGVVESATGQQKEEIKSTLIEITEVRKFKGQFGEYEKTKEGVRLDEETTVSTKSDIDELEKQIDLEFDRQLQEFLKNQEERKSVSLGRLKEIEELLSM